jgi:hypothetical protein
MALYAFDGFDHYGNYTSNGGDMLSRSGRLIWTGNPSLNGSSVGRAGYGKSVFFSSGGLGLIGVLASQFTHFFAGFALQMTQPGNVSVAFLDMTAGSGGTIQFSLVFNFTTATIQIFNGAGAMQISSAAGAFTPTLFNYVEIGAVVAASGSVTVRINGVQVLTVAFDTVASANTWVNGMSFSNIGGGSGNQYALDDLYWCDNTTGPGANPMNTFLGDVAVETLYPASNHAVSWTPLAGTNWQEISETGMDADTTYNATATVANVDTFNFQSLRAATNQVLAVQVVGAYRKDDATARVVQQRVLSGAVVGQGTALSIPTTYTYAVDVFVEDPNTAAAWTVAGVDALQAGYELTA